MRSFEASVWEAQSCETDFKSQISQIYDLNHRLSSTPGTVNSTLTFVWCGKGWKTHSDFCGCPFSWRVRSPASICWNCAGGALAGVGFQKVEKCLGFIELECHNSINFMHVAMITPLGMCMSGEPRPAPPGLQSLHPKMRRVGNDHLRFLLSQIPAVGYRHLKHPT